MGASWSGSRPFVGREAVRQALTCEIDAVIEQGGRAVFLLGPAGSGLTTCISVFQEQAFRRHRGLRAEYVDCSRSGLGTWLELAEIFTRGHRLKRSARRLAVAWLEAVPVVGDLLLAVASTVQALRTGRTARGRKELPVAARETALAAVRLLLQVGPRDPRLIVMDSLDRGDAEDLAGAAALIRRLSETRTLFLSAVRTSQGRLPEAIGNLIVEAERLGRGARIELPPLSLSEIEEAVSRATRGSVPARWLEWLALETEGNPAALWSALGALEEAGQLRRVRRRWVWEGSPPRHAAAAPRREWQLADEDGRLLSLAACEGQVFHSAVLAQLAELPELKVEDRLSELCRLRLLEYRGAPAIGDEVTSQYAFSNPADAEYFASGLSQSERADLAARALRIREALGL